MASPSDPSSLPPADRPSEIPSGSPIESSTDHVAEVDARGLNCPLPILKAKKALSTLTSGQVLKVLATDPGSVRDFNAFARQTGNALIKVDEAPQNTHTQHGGLQWAFYLQRR